MGCSLATRQVCGQRVRVLIFFKISYCYQKKCPIEVFLEVELYVGMTPKNRVADPHSLSADHDTTLSRTLDPDYVLQKVSFCQNRYRYGTYLPVCETVFICYFNINHVQLKNLLFFSTEIKVSKFRKFLKMLN